MKIRKVTTSIGLSLLFMNGLSAETVVLEPAQDNSIFSEGALSNGAGIYMYVGKTGSSAGFAERRALMQFDLSGIPIGATIDSASLQLTVNKVARQAGGPHQFTLHKMLRDWGEGSSNSGSPGGEGIAAQTNDATWFNAFHPGTAWLSQGGDFEGIASASTGITGLGSYNWTNASLVADVQAWTDTPETNFGWILIGPDINQTARRFGSREQGSSSTRPQLTITYTYDPPPTTWSGYAIEEDGITVDTGNWLGWVNIVHAPWIWIYDWEDYMYIPEQDVPNQGGWLWISK